MMSVRNVPRGTQRSLGASVAAPIGGWNARDAIGDMDKTDAVTLQNWWPGTNSVILRKGYSPHATGIGAQVESIMAYSSGTTDTLFAAGGTSIYNATSAGAVGAAVVTGLTNARLQHVNFTITAGTSYLMFVNGADKMRSWNGSVWHADGDGAGYDVTGFDTATATNIAIFKNRIWLIEKQKLKAWYLPVNAISGAATSLDLSALCMFGGYCVAAMTWTLDAGYGVDDYLAFITSNGEVLVWRLTDPTTPSGIAIIGVYQIGAPVGLRCWAKYGGDLLLITNDGVVPMSAALQSSRLDPRKSITNKIQYAMNQAIVQSGTNFGWQLLGFPKANQLYLNVPVNEGSYQEQFVQNNITGAWCNFTGWAANCWELFNDDPYFGGNGFVGRAWYGTSDNSADIQGLALQAFHAYQGARQKQVKMVRYHLASDGTPSVYGNVNTDFSTADVSAELTASAPTFGVWGSGVWGTFIWGSGMNPIADWQGATGIGFSFAPFLKTASAGISLEWVSTDMIFEPGGVL